MSDTLRRRLLLAAPLLLTAWVALSLAGVWMQRLPYPYDLEWMEGGVLAHAWRIQHFESVYTEPSGDFIPMIYPPGYYGLLAFLGFPFGLSAPLGRFVSLLGTLAALGALVWGSREHLGRWVPGVLAGGVYLGTYELTGAFMDLVRPDAVGLGLLAWSLVLAPADRRRAPEIAGLLLLASFTVKHNAGVFVFAVAPALWVWRGRDAALRYAAAFAGPAMLFTGLVQLLSGGRFLAYLLGIPASHPMKWLRFFPGTPTEIGVAMPVACTAVAVGALGNAARVAPKVPVPAHVLSGIGAAALMIMTTQPIKEAPGGRGATGLILVGVGLLATLTALVGQLMERRLDGPWLYGTLTVGVALAAAGLMRGHHGGFVNVFMPACWVLSAGFGVMVHQAIEEAPRENGTALVALAASVQLALLPASTDLSRFVPTDADYEAGDAIVETLKTIDGPVLSPYAAFLPALAGKAPSTHLIAVWDVGHKGSPFPQRTSDFDQAITDQKWAAILDAKDTMKHGVRRHYKVAKSFELPGRALKPRTGWQARPEVLLTPDGRPPAE